MNVPWRAQRNFTVYAPRLREWRVFRGHREEHEVSLFPGYCFVQIALQWSQACWCPGVIRLVFNGDGPVKLSDSVIEEIKVREHRGAIELAKRPRFRPATRFV